MQPSKTSVNGLFQKEQQYLIPIFQRGYVWTLEEQVAPLWADVADRAAALDEFKRIQKQVDNRVLKPLQKHFLGTIVLGAPLSGGFGSVPTVEVIDGQQRITTLQILLLAFRDVARRLEDDFIDGAFRTLTLNPASYRQGEHAFKVWPTNATRDQIRALVETERPGEVCRRFPIRGSDKKKIKRPLMVEAYLYFYGVIDAFLKGKSFDDTLETGSEGFRGDEKSVSDYLIRSIRHDAALVTVVQDAPLDRARAELLLETLEGCFQVMALHLEGEDDPQIIFETLNARGAQLFPSDLVRNFVFLQAVRKREDVDVLYNEYWKEFDERLADRGQAKGDRFWKQEERQGRLKNSRLDLLLYHYVGLRTQHETKVAHVFQEFKGWWEEKTQSTAEELGRINGVAATFGAMLVPEKTSRFGLFSHRMKVLDTATVTPVVLFLAEKHGTSSFPFEVAISDIESYLVRRFVCGLTTKGYNRIFMRLLEELVQSEESSELRVRNYLRGLGGESQVWPDDGQFEQGWLSRPLYLTMKQGRARMVLEALELAHRTSKHEDLPLPSDLTIEHVLPQEWRVEVWPLKEDTSTARASRSQLLHTVGNLTLLTQPMNSALQNGPFRAKRPEITQSLLRLNAYFQRQPNGELWGDDDRAWMEDQIVERGQHLFTVAKKIWPFPGVPQDATALLPR